MVTVYENGYEYGNIYIYVFLYSALYIHYAAYDYSKILGYLRSMYGVLRLHLFCFKIPFQTNLIIAGYQDLLLECIYPGSGLDSFKIFLHFKPDEN